MPSHENLTPKGTRRDIVNEENINISLIDGSPLDSKTKEGVKDEEHNERNSRNSTKQNDLFTWIYIPQ